MCELRLLHVYSKFLPATRKRSESCLHGLAHAPHRRKKKGIHPLKKRIP